MQNDNINAAIYCRLSVADKVSERDNSDSIDSQKMMLERYAKENGFVVVGHYVEACDIIEPTQKTA